MLLSMTGYGRASKAYKDKTIVAEIKSLNGRNTDLRLKLPNTYKEQELTIRNLILGGVERGKVEASIEIASDLGDGEYGLNKQLFKKYFAELNSLQQDLNIESADLVQAILRIPNVIQTESQEIDDDEWIVLSNVISAALENLKAFRKKEGEATKKDLAEKINNIKSLLDGVEPFEMERIELLKKRMKKNLDDFLGSENVDQNRFEQEVLFYMEKIDINEEKMRLSQHCDYFLEEMNSNGTLKGRKLSFIGQEIGREINTMGAKAQNSEIQKLVVRMKDELEQIKEQVANVL